LAKVELNKSIEARKLNQRSGLPMTGPEVTIPYVAIIEHVETDRDREKFHYLGELYSCRHEVFVAAVNAAAPAAPAEQTAPASPSLYPARQSCNGSHWTRATMLSCGPRCRAGGWWLWPAPA